MSPGSTTSAIGPADERAGVVAGGLLDGRVGADDATVGVVDTTTARGVLVGVEQRLATVAAIERGVRGALPASQARNARAESFAHHPRLLDLLGAEHQRADALGEADRELARPSRCRDRPACRG